MTIKPSMPSERISHMKSKRFWPGVPNRYRTKSSSTVIRPKSIATVVACLTARSLSDEIFLSVETTSISLTERINSVLPALNGPVTTILTVCISSHPQNNLDGTNSRDQTVDQRFLLFTHFRRHRRAGLFDGQRGTIRTDNFHQPG